MGCFLFGIPIWGAIKPHEIKQLKVALEARNTDPQTVNHRVEFMRADNGRQFIMINSLQLSTNPPNVEGAQPGEDANQLLKRYLVFIVPELLKRTSHPIFSGPAVYSALDHKEIVQGKYWTDGAVMRYRSGGLLWRW